MNEVIVRTNQSIDEKRNQLKKMVDESSSWTVNLRVDSESHMAIMKKDNKSDASEILSAGLGAFVGSAMTSKIIKKSRSISKVAKLTSALFLALATAISCVLSKDKKSKPTTDSLLDTPDITTLRNDVISKGIASVKIITGEWDTFMEDKQKEMYAVIDSSPLTENQKYELNSKIFTYEVIDINLSELMNMINSANSIEEISHQLEAFKKKLISSIEDAANSQKAKYDSLITEGGIIEPQLSKIPIQ